MERLGAGGDGIASHQGKPVYAPGLLPGERAKVRLTDKRGDGRLAETVERLTDSPDRAGPPCRYADDCGGCAVQHLAESAYLRWKEGLLDAALAAKWLTPERRLPMLQVREGRRRIRLAAIGRAGGAVVGFNVKASRRIVDIDACLAADAALSDFPVRVRPLLNSSLKPGETADVEARTSGVGVDVLLIRARPLDRDERIAVVDWMAAAGVARLAWMPSDSEEPEIIAEVSAPALKLGDLTVTPPPGAFLQPTAGGEAAMAAFAARRLAGLGRVADLYCGWGAFALRLARPALVEGYEGSAAMIQSLNRAAGAAGLGGHLQGHVRDLARQPLLTEDLKRFDGLVLDPPRSGARVQAEALAAAGPPTIVYLSCNPAALARDARALVDGGYRFREAQAIDQFRWTPHLEVACLFERER